MLDNKCWTSWINNDSPSTGTGDAETNAGGCAGAAHFDCQTVEGLTLVDMELNKTNCTSSGITCLNSDQRADRSCPDFKVRYVCSCPSKTFCHFFLCLFSGNNNFYDPQFKKLTKYDALHFHRVFVLFLNHGIRKTSRL